MEGRRAGSEEELRDGDGDGGGGGGGGGTGAKKRRQVLNRRGFEMGD